MEDARRECYERIKNCMQDGISGYYKRFPDLTGDDRSKRAIAESLEGLRCILAILDDYELSVKKEEEK